MGIADTYITIRPDTSEFRAEADAELHKALADAGITVKVKADTASARRDLDTFTRDAQGRLHDSLGRYVAEGTLAGESYGKAFNQAAGKSVGGNGLEDRLSKLALPVPGLGVAGIATLGPAIAGIGATALPVLGGLAASFATAGAGAAAFGAVAVPAFEHIQANSKTLATAQANLSKAQEQLNTATTKAQRQAADRSIQKALDAQSAALAKLNPAEKQAVEQYNAFSGALKQFQRDVEPAVYPALAGGFKDITDNLPLLKPLIDGAGSAITQLETEADQALGSPLWHSFFDFLGGAAHDNMLSLGHDVGNVAEGLAGLLQGLTPLETGVQRTLTSITQDFANFGIKASIGQDAGFNGFLHFTDTIAPQVKTDLRDIGGLLGGTLTGLAPSVGPSLKLLDDLAKGLGPVIAPLEKDLPGVIKDVDSVVVKLSPLAGLLSSGFGKGVASEVHEVAGVIGDLADAANKLPAPVVKALGDAIGVMVTYATISKLTGLSKLPGIIKSIGAASAEAAPGVAAFDAAESGIGGGKGGGISGVAGGMSTVGRNAETAAPKVNKLTKAFHDFGAAIPYIGPVLAGADPFQNFIYKVDPVIKELDKEAQAQGGYWTQAKQGLKSYTDELAKALGGPTHETANHPQNSNINKLNNQLFNTDKFFTIKAKDEASPVVKRAEANANAFAKLHPGVALSAQDQTQGPTADAMRHLQLFTHHPSSVLLSAKDKASGPTADAMRHLQLFTQTPSSVTLHANDHASGTVNRIRDALAALHDKTINVRTYETTILQTLRQSTGRVTAHAAGGSVQAGEWSWVGEQGPELAYFGAPAQIYNHQQSAGMGAGLNGSVDYDRISALIDKALSVRTAPLIGHADFHDNTDVELALRRAAFVMETTGLARG